MKQRFARFGIAWVMAVCVAIGSVALIAPAVYAEKASSATKKADQQKVAKFVGSSESKKYHKPSCAWVKKISRDNRVEFASKAEAEKAGYMPCKVCLASAKDTSTKTGSTVTSATKIEKKTPKSTP